MIWSLPTYERIALLVAERTGLVFSPTRAGSVESSIRDCAARAGAPDTDQYLARLESDRGLLDELVAELTVSETYFFRDQGQFDVLRHLVVPELGRLRGGAPIRVWSAGCATGEEPYSLAILLEELATPYHLLGTDLSTRALGAARSATYTSWSLRGVHPDVVERCFRRSGNSFALERRYRERVVFEYLNLRTDAYPSFQTGTFGLDLILCRNVLIYLDGPTIRHTAECFHASLLDGGYLITAPSDPPLWDLAPFVTVETSAGIIYRRGAAEAPVVAAPPPVLELPPVAPPRPKPPEEPRPEDPDALLVEIKALANAGQSARAAERCRELLGRHPTHAALHQFHAILCLDLDRLEEAHSAVRSALFLDGKMAVAHFTLGAILVRRGDREGARRAYRNARDLCRALPPDQELVGADGEHAGMMLRAAEAQLEILDRFTES